MIDFPQTLVTALRTANHIVVMTGAGVSAESGIPTFRDALTGLWSEFDPEQLATPEAFLRNPKLVWEWYAWRRELVAQCEPNAGHFAIAAMEKHAKRLTLVTQNVDGLHQAAGSSAPIELHGNIGRIKCFDNHHPILQMPTTDEVPPRCPECTSLLRPDVVWFGEGLDPNHIEPAFWAAENCDVLLSIGTSSVVYPAALMPQAALEKGATVVEVNPNPTPLSRSADYVLTGASGQVLPALVEAVWPKQIT